MAWEVRWAPNAGDDLEKAAAYIAKDSPRYSSVFAQEALAAADSLERLAIRGRAVPEAHDPTIRELYVMNYRLIYQITSNTVFILGFIHGSRDLWTLWKTKKRKGK